VEYEYVHGLVWGQFTKTCVSQGVASGGRGQHHPHIKHEIGASTATLSVLQTVTHTGRGEGEAERRVTTVTGLSVSEFVDVLAQQSIERDKGCEGVSLLRSALVDLTRQLAQHVNGFIPRGRSGESGHEWRHSRPRMWRCGGSHSSQFGKERSLSK
jgi:hypothetical protein